MSRACSSVLLLAVLACTRAVSPEASPAAPNDISAAPPNTSVAADSLRVLFIGNSLTYFNDMPAMVRALADSAREARPMRMQAVAHPDFALEDHLVQGDALRALRGARWDVVVLQQGPSAAPGNRINLSEYAGRFDTHIRAAGGRPALYMVWPSTVRSQDFDGVRLSYAAAAANVNGVLFPAGEAWRAAWRRQPALRLYSGDGFHPSSAGSYLAALVIHSMLYGRPPLARENLDYGTGRVHITSAEARVFEEAAAEAIQQHGLK
jgi:hypothetical protein